MPKPSRYLLISLPTSIAENNERDSAITALRSGVGLDNGSTTPFEIPELKVGTLDALVRHADELSKLQSNCEAVIGRIGDCLKNLLEGDEAKIDQQKKVNDKPPDGYLHSFRWNKSKYRIDRSIAELIDVLSKQINSIDNDVKNKYTAYNQSKTSLVNLQKKQTGNLSTKSLTAVVPPNLIINDSEYLDTHLVAVPNTLVKDFPKVYETISPWVVPRSAVKVASDDEFTLYTVGVFKKYSQEFIHKCREQKWVPRESKFTEGGLEAEKKELSKVGKEERKLWGEALSLSRVSWGEAVMVWIHFMAIRVFVESILRYGLPASFVCGLVKTDNKKLKKIENSMIEHYGYLGGNAISRDKKGRIQKDDSATSGDGQAAAAMQDGDYTPYVCYDFEI